MQAAAAVDLVVTQAHLQSAQGPLLARALGLELQHGGLATQAALEIEVGVERELFVLQLALAAQRTGQVSGHFPEPVGRIEIGQLQRRIPGHAIGESHADAAGGLALPGFQYKLRQADPLQVALERAGEGEGPGRPVQVTAEIPLVVAIAVLHLGLEAMQHHLRRLVQWIQAQPGKVLPVEGGRGAQGLLPVGAGGQGQELLGRGGQVQPRHFRALGIDPAAQCQGDRAVLRGEVARAHQLVAGLEIAVGGQFELAEQQGVRQAGGGLEITGTQMDLRRQVVRQRLQLASQPALQVAAAVGLHIEAFLQLALDLQRQLPGLAVHRRQLHLPLGLQRPVAARLQQALQGQVQVFALEIEAIDLQALAGPVRGQGQAAQLLGTIQAQRTDLDFTQLDGQRQIEVRQFQRAAVRIGCGRGEGQLDLRGMQLVHAQGAPEQAARGPFQQRRG